MSIVRARGCASRNYDRPELADLGKLIPNKPKPKKKRKRRSKRRQEARRRRAAAAVGSEGTDDRPARIDQEFAAIARGF